MLLPRKPKINETIARVGQRFNLNTREELGSIIRSEHGMLNLRLSYVRSYILLSHLTVLMVPIEYVLGMK